MNNDKVMEMYIVLENGKPAVIRGGTSQTWQRCIFLTPQEAYTYAEIWCGRIIEGRELFADDWIKGVDISQTEDRIIVSIMSIIVPDISDRLHYPPGVR